MMLAVIALIGMISVKMPPPPEPPPVVEVHRVALACAQIDMQEATQWKKKAKVSAALPRLQIDFGHYWRNYVDVNVNDNVYVGSSGVVVGPEEGGYKASNNFSRNIGFKVVWSLNELIFNRDLLNVSRQGLVILRERNAVLEAVNKHYFERKKLIGEIDLIEEMGRKEGLSFKLKNALIGKKVELQKQTAALDALTGGWFSEQLVRGR